MAYIIRERRPESRFPLGQLVITTAASEVLSPDEDDRGANERALLDGSRLFSAYHDQKGTKFWIITEAERSTTTVLLPDDY